MSLRLLFGNKLGFLRDMFDKCSTVVRQSFDYASTNSRSVVEQQSKLTRRSLEGVSNKTRTSSEAQPSSSRRSAEGLITRCAVFNKRTLNVTLVSKSGMSTLRQAQDVKEA